MKIIVLGILVFLVFVNLYTFLKFRRRKKNKQPDSVTTFHSRYLDRDSLSKPKASSNFQDRLTPSDYKKQVTKHNSQLDYINAASTIDIIKGESFAIKKEK